MLLVWNADSSIAKQNDCKNKTSWSTQTTLSKSFSLFNTTYIEDIKQLLLFKTYFISKDSARKSFLNLRNM